MHIRALHTRASSTDIHRHVRTGQYSAAAGWGSPNRFPRLSSVFDSNIIWPLKWKSRMLRIWLKIDRTCRCAHVGNKMALLGSVVWSRIMIWMKIVRAYLVNMRYVWMFERLWWTPTVVLNDNQGCLIVLSGCDERQPLYWTTTKAVWLLWAVVAYISWQNGQTYKMVAKMAAK